MNSRTKQLILACTFPVLILVVICVKPVYTLLAGEEIILQTMPVDPTDLFRGDYVALRYEAEEVPKQLVEDEVLTKYDKNWGELDVYVLLAEKKGVHTPVKVTMKKPSRGIYLKGTLNYIEKTEDGEEHAFIEYNLDKYYVEDNTGTEWEKASAQGDILAKIKVNNGYAILKDIEMK
ncbi:GDYXXLXY domain-containing protein [Neobacillus jeddahensis]|uniref:GDYXXLXY domain-containing protein n=1 Tax=Neobacillus jeddahensis TaxID=1461580 RepID=UPI00059178D1|nr:GDYXXLXY domain-containing protein [Neobacillus jeddahensis]